MTDKEQLAEAANLLINDSDAPELYQTLMDVLGLPANLPIKLSGPAAALNPLLSVARTDREKFDRVLDLVDAKRVLRELPTLRGPAAQVKFDKNRYQRELMAERRVRQIKAVSIENLRRPPSAKLVGHARMEFMRVQQGKWSAQLDALLEAASGGKPMSKPQAQKESAGFWARIDQQLEEAETAVYRWIQSGRKGEAP